MEANELIRSWYSYDKVDKVIVPNPITWRSRYDLKEQELLPDGNIVIRNLRPADMIPIRSADDVEHIVTPAENYRPDIVAYNAYQDPNLAWVILSANGLSDIFDFKSGLEIIIPGISGLYQSHGVLNR